MSNTKVHFVTRYYPYAKKASLHTGIPVVFALAQSALESGWGKSAKGNMMFGIKKGSGINYGGWQGHSQLITTTEYFSTASRRFPFVYPGYPVQTASGMWKYRIKDLFRAYPSPFHSFVDWAGLLLKNSRYQNAIQHRNDPYRFADEIAKAGYATDPNYATKIKSIMREVDQIIRQQKLDKKVSVAVVPLPYIGMGLSLFAVIAAIAFMNQKKAM